MQTQKIAMMSLFSSKQKHKLKKKEMFENFILLEKFYLVR